MASHIKTQLTQISTSAGGTHRDLAEKYKVVLEAILKLGEQDILLSSIVNLSIGCLSLIDHGHRDLLDGRLNPCPRLLQVPKCFVPVKCFEPV